MGELREQFLSLYPVLLPVLVPKHRLSNFSPTTTLWINYYYYSHFIDGENWGTERLSPQETRWIDGRAGICTQEDSLQSSIHNHHAMTSLHPHMVGNTWKWSPSPCIWNTDFHPSPNTPFLRNKLWMSTHTDSCSGFDVFKSPHFTALVLNLLLFGTNAKWHSKKNKIVREREP